MNFYIREVNEKDYKKICELFREADLLCHKNLPHVFRGAGGPEETGKFIVECCLKLFERLECRDYCRFDWRLDSEGSPKLLEVNPNPGWCWNGHLAKMAKIAGILYDEMLKMILQAAEQRLKLQNFFYTRSVICYITRREVNYNAQIH